MSAEDILRRCGLTASDVARIANKNSEPDTHTRSGLDTWYERMNARLDILEKKFAGTK